MPTAFKEWAVTVRALTEGEQLVILRRHPNGRVRKRFRPEHKKFFLYPTFDHHRSELVRESHQAELKRGLEEGVWVNEKIPGKAAKFNWELPQPERVRIRGWAEIAAQYSITHPRCMHELSPFYIWTNDYAEKQLAWRYDEPLQLLLLRTHRIPRPVTVKVREEYVENHPWINLHRDLQFEGTPVLCDSEFDRAKQTIEEIVSENSPELAQLTG